MPAFRALIIAIALVFTCSLVGIVPEAAASNGGNNINPSATATKKKKKPAPQVTKTKPKKAVASASNAPAKGEKRYRTGEVLFVLIAGKTDDDLQDLVRKEALRRIDEADIALLKSRVHRYAITDGRSVAQVIVALEADGRVALAQPNYIYELAEEASAGLQFSNTLVHLEAAHAMATGNGITIGLVDSRVDVAHPSLAGSIKETYSSVDNPSAAADGHGTAMAGAIAAHGAALTGMAPASRLVAAETFSRDGDGKMEGVTFHILKGIDWVNGQDASIINMSFAGPRDPLIGDIVKVATEAGRILVAAAGNGGAKAPPLYPAADGNVIAVSAVDQNRKAFAGANRGKYIDISAPGVDVLVIQPGNGTGLSTGTSVATAHVSGLLALALERARHLDRQAAGALITKTAQRLDAPATAVGAGLIDALATAEKAAAAAVQQ